MSNDQRKRLPAPASVNQGFAIFSLFEKKSRNHAFCFEVPEALENPTPQSLRIARPTGFSI
jgi:hypothetical protein